MKFECMVTIISRGQWTAKLDRYRVHTLAYLNDHSQLRQETYLHQDICRALLIKANMAGATIVQSNSGTVHRDLQYRRLFDVAAHLGTHTLETVYKLTCREHTPPITLPCKSEPYLSMHVGRSRPLGSTLDVQGRMVSCMTSNGRYQIHQIQIYLIENALNGRAVEPCICFFTSLGFNRSWPSFPSHVCISPARCWANTKR